MRRTKADTELTRQALLDAAETLFWEQGAARTSVLDIAAGAGVTRGAFYHHFKDKEVLFQALVDRSRGLEETEGLDMLGEDGDALDGLRAFCLGVFEFFAADRSQQRMFGIVMQGREALGDLEAIARQRRDEICRTSLAYERALERARQTGRLSESWTPRIAAITLYSAMVGLANQWLRDPERFDIRAIGIACINQLLDAFESDGSRESNAPRTARE